MRTLILACGLVLAAPLTAQLPLPAPPPPAEEGSVPLQDLAADRARIEAGLAGATAKLATAQAAQAAPEENRSEEDQQILRDEVGYLQVQVGQYRRHLELLGEVAALRAETQQLREEAARWTGFPEPPPYSLALVEKTWQALRKQQRNATVDALRVPMFERSRAQALAGLQDAEQKFRTTLEALEAARSDDEKQIARRRHDLATLAREVSQTLVSYLKAAQRLLEERQVLHQLRRELWHRQLAVALRGLAIDPVDLEARLQALEDEADGLSKALARPSASEAAIDRRLEAARDRQAAGQQGGPRTEELAAEVALLEQHSGMLRGLVEILSIHLTSLQSEQTLWRERQALLKDWDVVKAKSRRDSLEDQLQAMDGSLQVIELTQEELEAFRAAPGPETRAVAAAREALLEAVNERRAQLESLHRSMARQRDFLQLLHLEIETRLQDMGVADQVGGWFQSVRAHLVRLWNYELFSIEDTLVVDGERIVERRPVTLGKVVVAILILAVGLVVASAIARLIGALLLPFAKRDWRGRLIVEKLIRVGLIVGVLAVALVTVKIPLTVFAFLGGALAIGVGFGAQNLINNFISGFILLAERPIRPGDLIEVEGSQGTVEAIGERCTRIRRADGVEILIPNSQFLENSVTNMTLSDRRMRSQIQVGVAYGASTRQVHDILLEVTAAHDCVLRDPPPRVQFDEFGDNALTFTVLFWCDVNGPLPMPVVASDLRHAIGERLAEQGIEIPFPQADLHLDASRPIPVEMVTPRKSVDP